MPNPLNHMELSDRTFVLFSSTESLVFKLIIGAAGLALNNNKENGLRTSTILSQS